MKKYCMMAIALMMSVAIHAQRDNTDNSKWNFHK